MNIKDLNEIKYICKIWHSIIIDIINNKIKHIYKIKIFIENNHENIEVKFCKNDKEKWYNQKESLNDLNLYNYNIKKLYIDMKFDEKHKNNITLELFKILQNIYNNNIIKECHYSYLSENFISKKTDFDEIASYVTNNTNIIYIYNINEYIKIRKNNKVTKLSLFCPIKLTEMLYLKELTIDNNINYNEIIDTLKFINTEKININLITLLKFPDDYKFKGIKEIKMNGYGQLTDIGISKIVNIINTNKVEKIVWDCSYVTEKIIEKLSKSYTGKLYITELCLKQTERSDEFDNMTKELMKLL
jgi:hypothetical protein